MDRALAAEWGSPYVHLAAFAIDIDRAYGQSELSGLPFGWEVWLTELQLLDAIGGLRPETQLGLLEGVCLGILAQAPGEQALGSQLAFAVYDGLRRGALPSALSSAFDSWRKPPRQLLDALDELTRERARWAAKLAEHCLALELSPPLSELTRTALMAIRERYKGADVDSI
jgi:hypothetical protein